MSILVYIENWDGKFKKSAYEMATYAHETAKLSNETCIAATIGDVADVELQKIALYGVHKVIKIQDEAVNTFSAKNYSEALAQLAEKENSNLVLMSNNISGKALSPILSVRLKAGLVAGAVSLASSINPLVVKKKVFSGKAIATVKVNSEKAIMTLNPNSFGMKENPQELHVETFAPSGLTTQNELKIVEKNQQTDKVLLTDAEIVVSGGRGMKSPDNWKPIEEIAELLGGATACSRPVSDEGWRPHEEHTGQTGKIIAPNLYIACGISGAIQHLAGVSSSKCIVAINTDKDAPIFEAADYGVVADVREVLPRFLEALKKFKAEQ